MIHVVNAIFKYIAGGSMAAGGLRAVLPSSSNAYHTRRLDRCKIASVGVSAAKCLCCGKASSLLFALCFVRQEPLGTEEIEPPRALLLRDNEISCVSSAAVAARASGKSGSGHAASKAAYSGRPVRMLPSWDLFRRGQRRACVDCDT